MTSTVHERLDTLERNAEGVEIHLNSLEEGQTGLLHAAIHSVETLHAIAKPRVVDDGRCPEAALAAHIYSYVPSRKAAASPPEICAWLVDAGFEMCGIEDDDAGLASTKLDPHFDIAARRMRAAGYWWYVIIYRTAEGASYYANQSPMMPETCGAAFFFREYTVFARALEWCSAALPATYFRPRAGS